MCSFWIGTICRQAQNRIIIVGTVTFSTFSRSHFHWAIHLEPDEIINYAWNRRIPQFGSTRNIVGATGFDLSSATAIVFANKIPNPTTRYRNHQTALPLQTTVPLIGCSPLLYGGSTSLEKYLLEELGEICSNIAEPPSISGSLLAHQCQPVLSTGKDIGLCPVGITHDFDPGLVAYNPPFRKQNPPFSIDFLSNPRLCPIVRGWCSSVTTVLTARSTPALRGRPTAAAWRPRGRATARPRPSWATAARSKHHG